MYSILVIKIPEFAWNVWTYPAFLIYNQTKCIIDTYRVSLDMYRDIIVSLKINDTEP